MTKKNDGDGMSEEKEDLYFSWEFQNKLGYVGGVDIDAIDDEVVIWVEDSYYTFEIPFDKFLEIAEEVKGRMNDKEK